MRIVFIGAVQFSEQALRCLLEIQANVVGVCTLEKSNGNHDHANLSQVSRANFIPVRDCPNVNSLESIDWIRRLAPDVIFCFGWSRLIHPPLLSVAPLGVLGFHPAALPANRGRHPLIWALALGLEVTASTFFFMDEGADSGDIVSQQIVPIKETDDAGQLYHRITEVALGQIRQFVPALEAGSYQRVAQDHTLANYWRKRSRRDGEIDWRMSAQCIRNLVRALSKPYVGAHFVYQGHDIKVWSAEIVTVASKNIEPGKVLSVCAEGVVVKAGTDAVRLVTTSRDFRISEGEYL